jgi:hypothetical protein
LVLTEPRLLAIFSASCSRSRFSSFDFRFILGMMPHLKGQDTSLFAEGIGR